MHIYRRQSVRLTNLLYTHLLGLIRAMYNRVYDKRSQITYIRYSLVFYNTYCTYHLQSMF